MARIKAIPICHRNPSCRSWRAYY